MPITRLLVVGAGALALAFPVTADAGTVSRTNTAITYQGAGGNDSVRVGSDGVLAFVESTFAITEANCPLASSTRADCPPAPAFVVNLLGGSDAIDGEAVTDGTVLRADAGAGADEITGTRNADVLAGGPDDDRVIGADGNDTLDGGAGNDYLGDGIGDDAVTGGPGNDVWLSGPGRDTFAGGDGSDSVDYTARTAPVSITLDGVANDGEGGEGDNTGADAEEAFGGSGSDRIVGNNLGNRLIGGPGDDSITGGAGEERIEGSEGNDTIDARDGRYDSIDCGPGSDVLYADPGDGAENCEIAPDPDGDGYIADDCAPANPAVHPNAGEIVGNSVDEDCKDGPLYLRVIAPTSYGVARKAKQSQAKFVRLLVSELRAGDNVEIRCTGGKKKGCAFAKKTVTVKAGKTTVNVATLLKKRYLKRNAVVELRVLRPNEIGRVQRLKIAKDGVVKSELLCLNVGATKPAKCG
jgi:hypothetical protein